jgi:hypothetical protein
MDPLGRCSSDNNGVSWRTLATELEPKPQTESKPNRLSSVGFSGWSVVAWLGWIFGFYFTCLGR